MGMNMITIAGKKIGNFISSELDFVKFVAESGNLCVDKKPSSMNMINGRGRSVIASVTILNKTLQENLGITAQQLFDMNYKKNILGSAVAGSLGLNAHAANMLAALFIATGQDAAHVVDGAHSITTVDLQENGVVVSVTLLIYQ